MQNNDGLIVGLVFTILIGIGVLFQNNYETRKEYKAKISAMEFAIKKHEESLKNQQELEKVKALLVNAEDELANVKEFARLYKDLLSVKPNTRHLTLLVCNTESGNRYDVVHTGIYDLTTTGICGIKTHWIEMIPEINEDNINSLYAGSLVIEYLLKKHDNNVYAAIKAYKGSIKNTAPVDKVMAMKIKHSNLKTLLVRL